MAQGLDIPEPLPIKAMTIKAESNEPKENVKIEQMGIQVEMQNEYLTAFFFFKKDSFPFFLFFRPSLSVLHVIFALCHTVHSEEAKEARSFK